MERTTSANKNDMSIAVSVQNLMFTTRHNFCAARQESAPQSATAYSSTRWLQHNKQKHET